MSNENHQYSVCQRSTLVVLNRCIRSKHGTKVKNNLRLMSITHKILVPFEAYCVHSSSTTVA